MSWQHRGLALISEPGLVANAPFWWREKSGRLQISYPIPFMEHYPKCFRSFVRLAFSCPIHFKPNRDTAATPIWSSQRLHCWWPRLRSKYGIGTATWSLDSVVGGKKLEKNPSCKNSQNSEERRPKGKTRKNEKGEKEVICKQDAALFEVNPCRRPLLEPPTQKSTELPWQIKRESQINNHCNLNQLAQCIRNRGGRSQTTTIDLRWSSFREISSSFVGALPEVREP